MKINLDKLCDICAAMGSLDPNLCEIEKELNSAGMSVYADSDKKTFKSIGDILEEIAANLDDDCKIDLEETNEEMIDVFNAVGEIGACSLQELHGARKMVDDNESEC